MSEAALRAVEEIEAALPAEDVVAGLADPETGRKMRAVLATHADPEFTVRFRAREQLGLAGLEDRGAEGFDRLWRDWTESFETFRIEPERRLAAGDRVVSLARVGGRTRTGGVEIEQAAAAVWTFENGTVTEVAFYLDPEEALREAGIDRRSR